VLDLTTAPGVLTLLLAAVVVFLVYRRSQEIRGKLQRANADLVEGHARLSTMLRSMGDAVIATDAQARVTLLNPVAELMTGWTQAQAMGQPVDSVFCIVNKQTRAAEVIPVGAALAKGTIQGLTNHMVLIARDRREFEISDSCAPIRDANQNVIGAILVFRDVTRDYAVQQALKAQQIQLAQQNDELRRSQEALVQASALQNAIFNSANFSSIATDAQGVIQIFNVGAQRMLGYAAVDVLNKSTPADISDPQEVIARALTLSTELATTIAPGFEALVFKASRGIEDIYELTYIRKDGSRFPAVVSVTALRDEHDAIIGYLLIGTDNTARKRVDAERGQVEQALQDKNVELEAARALAEKANLAKSDFLSSMSHELRTPLGAILGFAQLIESGNPAPTVAQKRSIDQILKAGWYLLDLINEILDLALIESGRLSLSLEPVSLAEVLASAKP
jgi:PAS domain S-box-containing protein